MLIDAGNNEDGPAVVSYLKKQGVKKIDYLVGTHPHEDHIGGLDDVIKAFPVGTFYMPAATADTATYREVVSAAKAKRLPITRGEEGLKLVDQENLKISFLAPIGPYHQGLNDWSIVTRVQYGSTSFLFTGDAENPSESEMLVASYGALKSDVLKVGHHGSISSTSAGFLQAVSPRYAVISVGTGNDYGHPHKETLSRLAAAKVEVYRTDQNGTVLATSDGKKIVFAVSKNAQPLAPTVKPAAKSTPAVKSVPKPTVKPETTAAYIGNKNTKKFHRPTCSTLPEPQNRVYFKTRDEAVTAGYVPCQKCKP